MKLVESMVIQCPFKGHTIGAVAFYGCDPAHDNPALRDRTMVLIRTGGATVYLYPTADELSRLSILAAEARDQNDSARGLPPIVAAVLTEPRRNRQ